MDYKNYYDKSGLERDAKPEDIKRAYRKLARKYHPDVSKEAGAEDRFKDTNEAYEVLRDPEKRAAYDQIRPSGASAQGGFQGPPGRDDGFEFQGGGYTGADASDFSDFFESVFGRRAAGARGPTQSGMRGQDHVARVELDLEDAFTGGTRHVSMRVPTLDARGQVVNRERTLKVTIPRGVRAGQQLRLAGQGTPGLGDGAAGDLYLEIAFRAHRFRLDGNDLILDLPVAPWEAALGATLKAPTPAGPVDMKIPAGSNGGRRLRLKGRGMPGKPAGDLYAVLRITLPPAADERMHRLYEQMAEQSDFNPRAALGV